MKLEDFIKIHWWDLTFWITLSATFIISFPHFFEGWVRWRWGFYNIDLIPFILIGFFLNYVNTQLRIQELYREVNKLREMKKR